MRCPKCQREVRELWEDPYHPEGQRVCENCFDREIIAIEILLVVLAALVAGMALYSWITR